MALNPRALSDAVYQFLHDRHLATLTTLRPDGTPHVVAVGFTFDPDACLARVITFASSHKVKNVLAQPGSAAALCQVDGGRWLTVEGTAMVSDDPVRVAEAVRRYALRYRQPKVREDRVVIEITVKRMMGRA